MSNSYNILFETLTPGHNKNKKNITRMRDIILDSNKLPEDSDYYEFKYLDRTY